MVRTVDGWGGRWDFSLFWLLLRGGIGAADVLAVVGALI